MGMDLNRPVSVVRVCALQTVPGRAADRAGAVEIREAESPRSQAVQVRGERARVSVTAQVPETQIIGEKQDEVRRRSRAGAKQGNAEEEDAGGSHRASACVCV